MQKFGPLEAAIMDRVWSAGRALTGRQVLAALDRDPPPAYTTVTTVMDILCRKGFLFRRRVGRSYQYAAAATREAYSAEVMSEVLDASKDQRATLLHFVGQLGPEEAAALRAAVDQAAGEQAARARGPREPGGSPRSASPRPEGPAGAGRDRSSR